MATGMSQNQKEMTADNLRKQLALAVRNIQWSYAIFWSISATQPGALEWREGYYNGDIKTRKTVQSVEIKADELGLQRSEQLRELYESLLIGETNPQAKRPTAALSPEDLTDAEWYFLVCMSFVFKIGQGLPGSTIAKNQTFWICNAHLADTKFFSRSLLAKSASIQTIVCFPHLEGVVELGTTELVPEDLNLIQHIKTTFLESSATVPKISSHVFNITSNNGLIPDNTHLPENQLLDCADGDTCSQNNSSDDFVDNVLIDDSNLIEGLNEEANWPFMDDAVSNCLNISTNSSDCVSQTYGNGNLETIGPHRNGTKGNDNFALDETQECNQQKQSSGGDEMHYQGDEMHYQSVLSNLLKSSQQLILGPYFRSGNRVSSFVGWKDGSSRSNLVKMGTPQKLLKKVLFGVAKMHENSRLESGKQNEKKDGPSKLVIEEMDRNHVLSERKRREKMNERFMILGSLIPSGGKVDKISVLDHTIEYLRQLERKVLELQSNNGVMEMTQTKSQDGTERISDNSCPNRTSKVKKPLSNKRKACNMDKDSLTDKITVRITGRTVLIEMSCPWKECALLEVMEAVKKLYLHLETVQSSNVDGMLNVTMKAKSKGLKVASASVIRQALHKVIWKA